MKRIAITMGEPGGVGPEVIVKALHHDNLSEIGSFLVIGDPPALEEAVRLAGLPLSVRAIRQIADSNPQAGTIEVLARGVEMSYPKGTPSEAAGIAVVDYIEEAVKLAMNREVHAVVTGPISKESLKKAGHRWPGHTELLAELTGTEEFAMMFVSEPLKVILCTIHIPLRDVPEQIHRKVVLKTIELAEIGTRMLGMTSPRIAVAGLNPHAGESGIMGDEESRVITPAVREARDAGINVTGPFPPDVVFHRAYKGEFDIIVCMYHDQGLIPFKMLAFESGVNVTVGLPIIRTSPDHGTGFDIAWKNAASPASMIEAIKLAVTMKLRDKEQEAGGTH